jgi:hypothetical protein
MFENIRFEFEGKQYIVDMRAYDVNCIVLPDGRALKADSWLESMPPKPEHLHEVNHSFKALKPEAIAQSLNGVVAQEITPIESKTPL